MKKLDFAFEDLMFSIRCSEEDESEIASLGNSFLQRVRESKSRFPTLSSKNAIFITALTVMSEKQESVQKKPLTQNKDSASAITTNNALSVQLLEKLPSILNKIKKINQLVKDDMFVK